MPRLGNPVRIILAAAVTAVLTTFAPAEAFAQSVRPYPAQVVRLVVPFSPGGPLDTVGRILAQRLSAKWGESVIVENMPGASGSIGAAHVSRSTPDGYTLLVAPFGTLVANPAIMQSVRYDPLTSFSPVGSIADVPLVLVVKGDSRFNSVDELVEFAKARPGTVKYGSGGIGQGAHLAAELFQRGAEVSLVHVPYRGNSAAVTDLLGGQIDLIFEGMVTSLPLISSGALKALAISSPSPAPSLPNIPAVAQSGSKGLKSFAIGSWFGLLAPTGTSETIVSKVNSDLNEILRDTEIDTRLRSLELTPTPGTPTDFANFMRTEVEKWRPLIKEMKITGQ